MDFDLRILNPQRAIDHINNHLYGPSGKLVFGDESTEVYHCGKLTGNLVLAQTSHVPIILSDVHWTVFDKMRKTGRNVSIGSLEVGRGKFREGANILDLYEFLNLRFNFPFDTYTSEPDLNRIPSLNVDFSVQYPVNQRSLKFTGPNFRTRVVMPFLHLCSPWMNADLRHLLPREVFLKEAGKAEKHA